MRSAASGGISSDPAPKVARLCGIPIAGDFSFLNFAFQIFLFIVDQKKNQASNWIPVVEVRPTLHLPGPLYSSYGRVSKQ
jgi:hypothetical protein